MSAFASLIGQPQAIALLTQAVAKDRIAPAYLFAGPPGVGKSLAAQGFLELLLVGRDVDSARLPADSARLDESARRQGGQNDDGLARRIAQRNHPDLLWVEPTYLHQGQRLSPAEAEAAGVKRKLPPSVRLEQIREITQFLGRPPLEAARSLVVIAQAETMAEPAANALLKTLEEPGPATLILLAPSVDALLPTLVSRCQRIPFLGLDRAAMTQILAAEHREILAHDEIMALAQGSPGAAIAHWQRIQTIPPELLTAAHQLPTSLRDCLTLARQIAKTLELEAQLWLIDYWQQAYWQQANDFVARSAGRLPLQLLETAKFYLLSSVSPQLVWEVTLMQMLP
jgi:DNA polymerase III subunit delta'